MKYILILMIFFSTNVFAQQEAKSKNILDSSKKIIQVEISCGECKFKMIGKSCDLAIKIEGKTYFVDGASIDDFGDAHAQDGFCKAIRKADAQGTIVKGRFKATYLKLKKNKV